MAADNPLSPYVGKLIHPLTRDAHLLTSGLIPLIPLIMQQKSHNTSSGLISLYEAWHFPLFLCGNLLPCKKHNHPRTSTRWIYPVRYVVRPQGGALRSPTNSNKRGPGPRTTVVPSSSFSVIYVTPAKTPDIMKLRHSCCPNSWSTDSAANEIVVILSH